MTTKEKKLILIKALGLNLGDMVEVGVHNKSTYIIYEENNDIFLKLDGGSYCLNIYHLVLDDWTKLERRVRYGDKKCDNFMCKDCPLRMLSCQTEGELVEKTLYEILDDTFRLNRFTPLSNVYNDLKQELDKAYIEK